MMEMMDKQLHLEMDMIAAGRRRYYRTLAEAEGGDRGHDTSYGRVLMPRFFQPLQDKIQEYLDRTSAGYMGKYRKLIAHVSADQCAWFTLRAVFNALMNELSVQHVCNQIGTDIECELKFGVLVKEQPFLVKYLRSSLREMNTESVSHVRTLLKGEADKKITWNPWTNHEKVQVGAVLLRCFQLCSNIIVLRTERFGKRSQVVIVPSDECLEWITTHQERHSIFNHVYLPCIIPPKPWSKINSGGYYSHEIQVRVPFIKTRSKTSLEAISGSNLEYLYTAANHLGGTPWRLNREVLGVMQEVWRKDLGCGLPRSTKLYPTSCPVQDIDKEDWTEEDKDRFIRWKREATVVHRLERSRVSNCLQFSRILGTAVKMKDYHRIYFPVQCDFRGRMYATTAAFSPQGPDYCKGLLQFAHGEPINTDEAYKWFLIHGANSYGFDKLSFDERMSRIGSVHDEICNAASNPVGSIRFWGEADSPWQFLAWCFEYRRLMQTRKNFVSYIPVGQDGSCNGLQHFSAMLRDECGGKATNLLPLGRPADIYQDVADRVRKKLEGGYNRFASCWFDHINRKVTKKSVMTLPYGATRQNCTMSIHTYVVENSLFRGEEFEASLFLAPILWTAIEETVIKARQAMDWLKKVALSACRHNLPMQWVSPSGLPVTHAQYKIESKKIKTVLYEIKTLSMGRFTDTLLSHKQSNGASPNFVHSLDASHLCFLMDRLKIERINHVGAVHDSFSTHAKYGERLAKCIREEFVRMYTEHDPLVELANQVGDVISIPDPPDKGILDLNNILKSEYFFH